MATIDDLTTATTGLITAVNVSKATLDASVATSLSHAGDSAASAAAAAASAAGSANGIGSKATKALLDAYLTPAAGITMMVTNDSTPSLNGLYSKVGDTGTGSWLQSSFDRMTLVEQTIAGSLVAGTPSKNLFNPAAAVHGFYINSANGNLTVGAAYYASDYIPVASNAAYSTVYMNMSAFYDVNKAYISGLPEMGGSFVTPSNAKFIRVTVPDASYATFQLESGTLPTTYVAFGSQLPASKLLDASVTQDKLGFDVIVGTPSVNLFNKATAMAGYYVDPAAGGLSALGTYTATDYIPVVAGTNYYNNVSELTAFYNESKVFISGVSYVNTFTAPAGACYMRTCMLNAAVDTCQIEVGAVGTFYQSFGSKVPLEALSTLAISNAVTITKTVKPDGTGDYLSPALAVAAIADASASRKYVLMVYPGVYTAVNWNTKDYIDIIGVDRDNCILQGYLAANTADATITAQSTINWNTNNRIANLTITAKNMRYPIHSDSGGATPNLVQVLENSTVIHYGNDEARANRIANSQDPNGVWASVVAWGGGTSSNYSLNILDCTLIAPMAPFSMHNSGSATMGSYVKVKNSRLIKSDLNAWGGSARIESLGEGKRSTIIFENCEMNSRVFHDSPAWYGAGGLSTNTEWNISIVGGNSVLFQNATLVNNDRYIRPQVLHETVEMLNNSGVTISRGMAVAYNTGYTSIRKMTNADAASAFIGIALADVANGFTVRVKKQGYEEDTFLSLESYATSTYLGATYGMSPTAGKLAIGATPVLMYGVDTNVVKFGA